MNIRGVKIEPPGVEARTSAVGHIFFMTANRSKNTPAVLLVQIRIRYRLKLQRVYFYMCIVITTMCFCKIKRLSPLFTDMKIKQHESQKQILSVKVIQPSVIRIQQFIFF